MTEKRFNYVAFDGFEDDGEYITPYQVCELLNGVHEENQDLKAFNKELAEELSVCANARISKDNRIKRLEEKIQRERKSYVKQHLRWSKEAETKIKELSEENEQLKQREETLLCEIDDFQELLAKNDGVCHKRVIDLIDDRIFNFSNMKAELLLNSDDDYRLEKLSFAIQNLRELRKELEE